MTVIKNTILARYDLGHVDIDKSNGTGRVEEYLELASARTRSGAVDLATQRLKVLKTDRTTLAYEGQVRDEAQALGTGFALGDKLDSDMLVSINISVDEYGNITAVPELNDPLYLAEEALDRKIQRIATGITSEYAAPNRDSEPEGSGTDTTPPAFSYSGPLSPTLSPTWTAPRPYWISWLELEISEFAAHTQVGVQIFKVKNAVPTLLGTCNIETGDYRAVATIDKGLKVGETIAMYVAEPGGAANLTATIRGTMV